MSTRSFIGKLEKDGSITYIYCHHDGYLSYVGKILKENYAAINIDRLLALGDLSSLGALPVSDNGAWDKMGMRTEKTKDFCVAYNDRGEFTVRKNVIDFNTYIDKANDSDVEYIYLLDNNAWKYVKIDWNANNGDYFRTENLKEVA